MTLASTIPKIHLHCHLEGSLRPATFVEFAREQGLPLRYRPEGSGDEASESVDAADPYRFESFRDFLYGFAAVNRTLSTPDRFARLAREFAEEARDRNVVYGELFVSPSVWTFFHPELDVRATLRDIIAELHAGGETCFQLIVDLTRNFGAESALRTARLAAEAAGDGVVGIGLGGDESRFPPELFVESFDYARAAGLHCVAHAGEAAGPQSVRDAVELLHAERIGHGIAALQSDSVVRLLRENRIPLEVCPTSNDRTGAALASGDAFQRFDDEGCVVVIDADDPPMFGTTIEREYARVESACGSQMLLRLVRNAVDGSFADDDLKRRLRALLPADVPPAGQEAQP
ncbi:MAG: adenosine deaminase [Candidatus Tumulicola sp.]